MDYVELGLQTEFYFNIGVCVKKLNIKPWGPSRQHTLPRWQPTVAARVANPATAQVENNPVPLPNRYFTVTPDSHQ